MTTLCARILTASLVLLAACSSNSAPATGRGCMTPADCYHGVADAGALGGKVVCLDIPGGYCSHECTQDSDCCAVSGECPAGIKQVCAPLESNPQTYCFVSCEAADITPSGDGGTDPNAFCASAAGAGFTCRSTGGGSANKKFCAH